MRVFVLGAGFSCGAGLPLGKELKELLLKKLDLDPGEAERLCDLNKELGDNASIEQIVDSLRSWESSRWQEEIPRQMEAALPGVILGRMPKQNEGCAYVSAFVRSLDDRDCIISFNYDLLVEHALGDREFNLGFEECSPGVLRLLKLHGSIDWRPTTLQGDPAPGVRTLFPGLLQVRDRQKLVASASPVMEALSHHDGLQSFGSPHIGFGGHKSPERIPGLMNVWRTAERFLSEANEVYVIGYSMPSTDREAKDMFTRASQARHEPLRRLALLDPSKSLDIKEYERAFSATAEHMIEPAEEIPWAQVMRTPAF